MENREVDAKSGVETTGHSWDGITELNNPLPRWWLWTFYITVIWGIGYMIAYPAVPMITEATKGMLGYSSRAEVAAEIAAVETGREATAAKLISTPLEQIPGNAGLYQFAVSGGRSAFKVHCSQCHGSGAAGSPGYPNLNDDDWLWAGTLEGIEATIRHGVRFDGDDDTRVSEMPAFGRDELLAKEEIANAAAYVRSLAKLETDAEMAAAGAPIYAENCASCHGEKGEGIRESGGPRLTDAIWHYGESEAEIRTQIANPKHGVMPAWGDRLDAVTIRQLTLYVHSLGGGE